jgi:hypothetical protein
MTVSQAKRKADDISLPGKGDDPAERKRVLNVLAQRRYRQRKREHVKKLEAASKSSRTDQTDAEEISVVHSPPSEDSGLGEVAETNLPKAQAQQPLPEIDQAAFDALDQAYPTYDFDQPGVLTQSNSTPTATDPFVLNMSRTVYPQDLGPQVTEYDWQLPWLPDTTSNSTQSTSLTSFSPSGSSSSSQTYDFPDDYHLEVLELALLRGATSIAKRLGIFELIWSLDSTSPFSDPLNAFTDYSHLPFNLQPTALQRRQTHSPIIDLLPWPSVRDKLIHIFSVPAEFRPASAAKPTAMIDFVYDLEDSAEGVRIWGDDPYNDKNWEVGEKLFKSWWWAFDTAVVEQSNVMRERRGARLLGQVGGSVLGEIT